MSRFLALEYAGSGGVPYNEPALSWPNVEIQNSKCADSLEILF
jgi:hypothetical protein